VFCVLNVASFSGMSILDCPLGFLSLSFIHESADCVRRTLYIEMTTSSLENVPFLAGFSELSILECPFTQSVAETLCHISVSPGIHFEKFTFSTYNYSALGGCHL
jgi:hypothetical protein